MNKEIEDMLGEPYVHEQEEAKAIRVKKGKYVPIPLDIYDVPIVNWMLDRYENHLLYVLTAPDDGQLYTWDGTKYTPDWDSNLNHFIEQGVGDLVKALEEEYNHLLELFKQSDASEDEVKAALARLKQAKGYWNEAKIRGLRAQIKVKIGIKASDFDANPDEINCLNNVIVIDRANKKIATRPHSPDDRFLKCIPFNINPDAKAPKWDDEVHKATNGNPRLYMEVRFELAHSLMRRPLKRVNR